MDIDFGKALRDEPEVIDVAGVTGTITLPQVAGSNDVEAAKHDLMQFRASVNAMQAEATALEVKDAETEKKGAEMTAQTKKLAKMVDERQDEIIGDASRFVKEVQNFTLPFRKDLKAIRELIDSKLSAYGYRKEMERRKSEELARKAAAEAQAKIDAEAKAAHIEPVVLPTIVVPKQNAPVRTESGTTSYIPKWDYEVVDVSKVPARYLLPDPTLRPAVMESIRAGIREIPGLKIFEKMITRTR